VSPAATKEKTPVWRLRGKREGGTVTGLAFSPGFANDRTVFAATMAGVYRSRDAGKSWQPVNDGLTSPFTICVAVSPRFVDDGTVLVGARAGGLYQTSNGGEEWHPVEIWGQRESVQAIALSPNFGRDHEALLGSESSGVYRTTTGGKTWSASNFGLLELGILALAYSPSFSDDQTAFCVTTNGLYRTPNGGRAWREAGSDLAGVALQCVAVSPTFKDDQFLIVGSEDEGIYLSTDGGRRWKESNKGLDDLCVNAVALSPQFAEDKTIVVGTNAGPFISRDRGATWKAAKGETGAILTLATGPDGLLLAGAAQAGVFRSEDGGASWASSSEGLSARLFVQLAVSPRFAEDKTLYSVSLDDGLTRSTDAGESWERVGTGLEEREVTGLTLSTGFGEDGTMFAATDQGLYRSTDAGATWGKIAPELSGLAVRFVALSPSFERDGTLFVSAAESAEEGAATRLWISRDRGESWEAGRETFDGQELVAAAFSPQYADDRTAYVGTYREATPQKRAEVAIWRSEDGGKSWLPLTSHITPGRWVAIAIPPTYARDRAVFVGVQSAVLRPMAGAMAAVRPGRRQLWYAERIGRPNTAVVSLVASPTYEKDHTLYAGTSDGVFVTRNGGISWQPMSQELGNRSIVSLALSPDYPRDGQLFAASLGGALWSFQEERKRAEG
jgi:photosystem II stability/assembly factor-like uncharacterized protein